MGPSAENEADPEFGSRVRAGFRETGTKAMYDDDSRGLNRPDRQRSTDTQLIADGGTTWTDLTAFQQSALLALAEHDEEIHGLGLKEILEGPEYYDDQTINHGRLYPNLDDLVERGLVEKGVVDRRTNSYVLTDAGEEVVRDHARHAIDILRDLGGDQEALADGGDV